VLSSPFEKLPATWHMSHGFPLLGVALATILLITPAVLHRIAWAGEESEPLLIMGGRITVLTLLPLAVGMAANAYVVVEERITWKC
jgi:Family of unknown function (DUF6328)